jgi:hypothetical protein
MFTTTQLTNRPRELQSKTGRLGAEVKEAASSSETPNAALTTFMSVIHAGLTPRMIDGG